MLRRVLTFGISKDTIAVLKFLLELALTARLHGLSVCYRTDDGKDQILFTGVYEKRPTEALLAASLMHVAAADRLIT